MRHLVSPRWRKQNQRGIELVYVTFILLVLLIGIAGDG